jgi:hypothetical protein
LVAAVILNNCGVEYWHGGRRNIAVGEFIRPRNARRREFSAVERKVEANNMRVGYDTDCDPNRIYVTTDLELARGWAMNEILRADGGGALYRVRPEPTMSIEPDPDYPPTSFSARRARVLEVVEDPVQMSIDDADRAVCLKYSRWSDGTAMYDWEGYMLPPPELRSVAADPARYRHLGKWCPVPYGHRVGLLSDSSIRVVYQQDWPSP